MVYNISIILLRVLAFCLLLCYTINRFVSSQSKPGSKLWQALRSATVLPLLERFKKGSGRGKQQGLSLLALGGLCE